MAAEEFRWLEEKGVDHRIWDKELQLERCKELFKETHGLLEDCYSYKLQRSLEQLRIKLWTRAEDLASQIKELEPVFQEVSDKPEREMSYFERGQELLWFLKEKTPSMDARTLLKFNRIVNLRRKREDEFKLCFSHFCGCKIVLEYWLSKKGWGKVQLKAKESHKRWLEIFHKHNIGAQLRGENNYSYNDEIKVDPEGGLYASMSLNVEEAVDMHMAAERVAERHNVYSLTERRTNHVSYQRTVSQSKALYIR